MQLILSPKIIPDRQLAITYEMQRALQILTLPLADLSILLREEIEKNPLLECELATESGYSYTEIELLAPQSLFQILMDQLREHLPKKDLHLAEALIGNLDKRGFFSASLKDLAEDLKTSVKTLQSILKTLQSCEPAGIGAKNIQECFLLQLKRKKAEKTLAFILVKNHFEDLTKNRIPLLQKKCRVTQEEMQKALHLLQTLIFHPASQYNEEKTGRVLPDIILEKKAAKWMVSVSAKTLPTLAMNEKYSALKKDPSLKQFYQSGNYLIKSLQQRKETLERLGKYLLKKQKSFFEKQGPLVPLNYREVAKDLGLHESTIARAVSDKYMHFAEKNLPLRCFFSSANFTSDGSQVASRSTMGILKKLIQEENKAQPFSDRKITEKLREQGIICSRRTVTKYRKLLKISSASQRRKY